MRFFGGTEEDAFVSGRFLGVDDDIPMAGARRRACLADAIR